MQLKHGEFISPEQWETLKPGTVLISDKSVMVIVVEARDVYTSDMLFEVTSGRLVHYSNHTGLKTI